jgi:hypothetical protein
MADPTPPKAPSMKSRRETSREAFDKAERVMTVAEANRKLPGKRLSSRTLNEFSRRTTRAR